MRGPCYTMGRMINEEHSTTPKPKGGKEIPMSIATARKITVREYIDGAAKGCDAYINTFQGRKKVAYIRNPESDPWVVTGTELDQASWCVHYGTILEVEEGTEPIHREGTCPGCNGEPGEQTKVKGVFTCQGCGGIFGTCYLGESYTLVKPNLRRASKEADERARYYDLTCLGSGNKITRRHGYYDPKTKLITQVG